LKTHPQFRRYSVYPDGKIYSHISKRFLVFQCKAGAGYLVVALQDDQKKKRRVYLHRLLAEIFLANPLGFKEVNHKNGDKDDNRLENLEWCSHLENMQHAWKTGLIPIQSGVDASGAKLKQKEIHEIIRLIDGGTRNGEIARRFKISRGAISNIRTGKTYRAEVAEARETLSKNDPSRVKVPS
jgi:hypothetical protein